MLNFKIRFGRKYKIKDKKKSLKLLSILLLIFGIGWIGASIFAHTYITNFKENGVKTEAVITSISKKSHGEDTDYYVLVEYKINGKKYQSYLNYYNSNMEEGQIIPIRYLTNNPNKIIYGKNEYLIFWMFLGGGILSLIISVNAFIAFKKEKFKQNEDKLINI